jgi:osmotically-inducible protein OsmY
MIMDDKQLRQLIIDELDFDPSIDSEHVGVAVGDGIVTLTGYVSSYTEKLTIERTTRSIRGVRGIAEKIEIRYPADRKTNDDKIAQRALQIIDWSAGIPEAVKVKVERGWVSLTGTVDWHYQRQAAEAAVRKLTGVVGISNLIQIRSVATVPGVKKSIEEALKRNAELEAASIRVSAADDKVTLEATVHAWHDRTLAERAAWAAPGVQSVDDRLRVD